MVRISVFKIYWLLLKFRNNFPREYEKNHQYIFQGAYSNLSVANLLIYISLAIEYLPCYFGLIKGSKTLRNKVSAATLPVKTDEQNLATPFAFSTKDLAISFLMVKL